MAQLYVGVILNTFFALSSEDFYTPVTVQCSYILFLSIMVVRSISTGLYIILHVTVDAGDFSVKLSTTSPSPPPPTHNLHMYYKYTNCPIDISIIHCIALCDIHCIALCDIHCTALCDIQQQHRHNVKVKIWQFLYGLGQALKIDTWRL
jgi:hypothetical protein